MSDEHPLAVSFIEENGVNVNMKAVSFQTQFTLAKYGYGGKNGYGFLAVQIRFMSYLYYYYLYSLLAYIYIHITCLASFFLMKASCCSFYFILPYLLSASQVEDVPLTFHMNILRLNLDFTTWIIYGQHNRWKQLC